MTYQAIQYGKPVRIKMHVGASGQASTFSQAIQQMWKRVGIETEIVIQEGTQNIRLAGLRQYQVMLYRWQGGIDPDKNVYSFFHSKGTTNRTAYNNPEMDKLLDAARATIDPAERLKLYRGVNNLLARDLPHLYLTYFNNYSVAAANVKGITPIPDGLIRVRDVWKDR